MIRKLQQDAIEARNLLVDMYHVVKTKQKKVFFPSTSCSYSDWIEFDLMVYL